MNPNPNRSTDWSTLPWSDIAICFFLAIAIWSVASCVARETEAQARVAIEQAKSVHTP